MNKTLEKIKTLLSVDNKESKEVKMYAEAILEDGRVVATEDEKMAVGSEIYVISDDGEASPLGEGTYTLQDGGKITIDTDSKITDLGADEEQKKEEYEEKEEMEEHESPAEKADWAKSYEELKDRVEELEKRVFGDDKDVDVEMSEEVEESKEEVEEVEEVEDEKLEMSKDMVNSLVEEVEHLKAKLVEFEKEPGAKGFKHNPESTSKKEIVNMSKLSTQERVAYFMNRNK
tara:strand:+ start:11163 stop:11855 length:693 start_codon:yes stop_codon:yes gene_type:complete